MFWYGTCGAPVRARNHNITHCPSGNSHTGHRWRWIDHHFPLPAANSICYRSGSHHRRQIRRRGEASIPGITGEKEHNRKLTAICVSDELAWNSKQGPILTCLDVNSGGKGTFLHVSEYVRFWNRRAPGYLIAFALCLPDAPLRDWGGTRYLKAGPKSGRV